MAQPDVSKDFGLACFQTTQYFTHRSVDNVCTGSHIEIPNGDIETVFIGMFVAIMAVLVAIIAVNLVAVTLDSLKRKGY